MSPLINQHVICNGTYHFARSKPGDVIALTGGRYFSEEISWRLSGGPEQDPVSMKVFDARRSF